MSIKCLMLETADKKKFFTLVGNYKQLLEYCRAFKAKMFVVRADIKKSQVMSIPKLVAALCDKTNEGQKAEYKMIERKKVV
jgi:hypothetical protein